MLSTNYEKFSDINSDSSFTVDVVVGFSIAEVDVEIFCFSIVTSGLLHEERIIKIYLNQILLHNVFSIALLTSNLFLILQLTLQNIFLKSRFNIIFIKRIYKNI